MHHIPYPDHTDLGRIRRKGNQRATFNPSAQSAARRSGLYRITAAQIVNAGQSGTALQYQRFRVRTEGPRTDCENAFRKDCRFTGTLGAYPLKISESRAVRPSGQKPVAVRRYHGTGLPPHPGRLGKTDRFCRDRNTIRGKPGHKAKAVMIGFVISRFPEIRVIIRRRFSGGTSKRSAAKNHPGGIDPAKNAGERDAGHPPFGTRFGYIPKEDLP